MKPLNLMVCLFALGVFAILPLVLTETTITVSSISSGSGSSSISDCADSYNTSINSWITCKGTWVGHLWFIPVHFSPQVKHNPFAFLCAFRVSQEESIMVFSLWVWSTLGVLCCLAEVGRDL
jgi:hypothetical protein